MPSSMVSFLLWRIRLHYIVSMCISHVKSDCQKGHLIIKDKEIYNSFFFFLIVQCISLLTPEQPHNTGPLLKLNIFSGSFARQWRKEREIIYTYALSPRSIYLVARMARQWMTKEQTSRLVWLMITSGPVFCSLASKDSGRNIWLLYEVKSDSSRWKPFLDWKSVVVFSEKLIQFNFNPLQDTLDKRFM